MFDRFGRGRKTLYTSLSNVCKRERERVDMFENIKKLERSLDDIETRDIDSQLDILIGRGVRGEERKQEN